MKRELTFLIFITVITENCIKAEMQQTDCNGYSMLMDLNFVVKMNNLGINSANNLFLDVVKSKDYYLTNYLQTAQFLIEDSSITYGKKRPLLLKTIFRELILGESFGIFGSLVGVVTGFELGQAESGYNGILLVPFGLLAGYTLGTSLGVYIAGYEEEQRGSFFATLGGGILGALGGFIIFEAFDERGLGSYAFALGPVTGSIIGFNLSRKPRESSDNALINYHQGKIQCSWRSVNIYYDCYHKPVFNVNLFQVNF